MNRNNQSIDNSNWGVAQRKSAQEEFGYTPQPSGLPGWRYEFPHRMSTVSPEFMQPAVVPAPEVFSTQSPEFLPDEDLSGQTEQSK